MVARWAHNPKVDGSNPSPATQISSNVESYFNFSIQKKVSVRIRLRPRSYGVTVALDTHSPLYTLINFRDMVERFTMPPCHGVRYGFESRYLGKRIARNRVTSRAWCTPNFYFDLAVQLRLFTLPIFFSYFWSCRLTVRPYPFHG